jgi:hypothetical protein
MRQTINVALKICVRVLCISIQICKHGFHCGGIWEICRVCVCVCVCVSGRARTRVTLVTLFPMSSDGNISPSAIQYQRLTQFMQIVSDSLTLHMNVDVFRPNSWRSRHSTENERNSENRTHGILRDMVEISTQCNSTHRACEHVSVQLVQTVG